jgi:DNA polymerase lambda
LAHVSYSFIVLGIDNNIFVEIMGSFRRQAWSLPIMLFLIPCCRGKADCGDIDILITRPTDDGKTHAGMCSLLKSSSHLILACSNKGILLPLLKALHVAGILTEDLTLPDDAHAQEAVYRGLCRLPNVNGSKRRRIDILTVPWTSRGAALLYYTVSKLFYSMT